VAFGQSVGPWFIWFVSRPVAPFSFSVGRSLCRSIGHVVNLPFGQSVYGGWVVGWLASGFVDWWFGLCVVWLQG
jgi:hypothetical protein